MFSAYLTVRSSERAVERVPERNGSGLPCNSPQFISAIFQLNVLQWATAE